MHVAAVLKRKGGTIISVRPTDTVSDAAKILSQHRIGAVLVIDDLGHPSGILSERDIVRCVAAQGPVALDKRASELMTRDIVTCQPTDTVAQVMAQMTQGRFRHVPVMEDGRLIGVISIGDVVKARLDDAEMEVESLRGYVAGMG